MEAERPHRGWVRLITVLVGILAVLAILSTWVDRQVFNTDQWGDTSVELIQNPTIRTAVANFAVQELYDNVDVQGEIEKNLAKINKDAAGPLSAPLASLARQGVDKLALKALESGQVQTLWQKANVAAHKTLIDVLENRSQILTTGSGQVQLELRPLIIEIASQVGLQSQAEKNIPASVASVHILDSEELATAQRVTKLIHGLALVSGLLTLVLIGLAVFLSPGYRWMTLIWLGVALIIAAAIVLILRPVAGGVVVDRLAAVDVQPAARAAWDIATDLLHSMAWTVIWSSLVLFVIAWLISPAGSAESARRFLAVPFGRYPLPVFGLLGLIAFIFLITGASDARGFILRVVIVALAALGAWAFRRQLMLEWPDANLDGLRDFGGRTAESARNVWQGSVSGVGRIFGSRRTTDAPVSESPEESATAQLAVPPAAPGSGSAEAGPPSGEPEAPTRVLPAGESERFELLERLGRLRESGVLSDEEFEAEKQRILGG